MSTKKSDTTRWKEFECQKVRFDSKGDAKAAAKTLARQFYPTKYEVYRCHDCKSWHTATKNRKKIKHNKQHSTGGRRHAVARRTAHRRRSHRPKNRGRRRR